MASKKKDVRAKRARETGARKKSVNSLPKIEPQPGAIVTRMIRCGRSNCKCARGLLHGPYHYRVTRHGGKQRKTYIKNSEVLAAKRAYSEYKQARKQGREVVKNFKKVLREMTRALIEYHREWGFEI
jgi:hypothetical protein